MSDELMTSIMYIVGAIAFAVGFMRDKIISSRSDYDKGFRDGKAAAKIELTEKLKNKYRDEGFVIAKKQMLRTNIVSYDPEVIKEAQSREAVLWNDKDLV